MRSFAALVLGLALGLGAWTASAPPAAAAAPAAEIAFAQDIFRVQENDGLALIRVHRAGLPVSRAEVFYETGDGSAQPDDDYETTYGRLVFEVGASDASFFVNLHDDEVAERLEQVSLELTPAYGSDTTTGPPAILMIVDNDPVPIPTTTIPRDLAAANRSTVTAPPSRLASGTVDTAQLPTTRRSSQSRQRLSTAQSQTTPFELRVQTGGIDDGSSVDDLAVDPSLAILAGLLLAVVAGKVWFACRPA